MRALGASRTSVATGGILGANWARNPLWKNARAVPSLDLRFAENKSLTDAKTGASLVTFTRASTGTFVGSDGLLRSAVTNYITGSADFSSTYTSLNNVTTTVDTTIAPDGSITGDTITGSSSALNIKYFYKLFSTTATGAYTASVYLKANTQSIVLLRLNDNTGVNGVKQLINLSTGQLSGSVSVDGTATNPSSSITPVGNGWYRCTVTCTFNSAITTLQGPAVFHDGYTTSTSTNSYFAWGAQLEQSSTVGEYIPTTSVINSAPRFDHNPTTGESLGLLVEEARTNSVTNNTMVGAVAGTPGTLPTGWGTFVSPTGLTRTIVGIGTVNGINYIDVRFSGTPSSTGEITLYLSPATTATLAQAWTSTAWLSLAGGSTSNIGVVNLRNFELNSGAYVREIGTSFVSSISSDFVRRQNITTSFGASANQIQLVLSIYATAAGTPIDITLRIGLPQLEQGAFATSVIPTTTATATRAADVASITGSNFGTTRTNLLLRSEELDNASWTKQSSVSVSANTTISPDGAFTADTVTADQSLGIFQNVAATVSTTYTNSVYIKAGTATAMMLRDDTGAGRHIVFNPSTGVITATSGTLVSSGSEALNNGWYRYFMTYVADTTTVRGIIRPNSAGSAQTFIAWGAQVETGSTATAYILTTTAAVSVFESSFYNQTEGTVFADAKVTAVAPATSLSSVFALSDGTTSNRIAVYKRANADTSTRLDVSTSGSSVAFINAGTFSVSNLIAISYRVDDFAISLNGLTPGTDTLGAIPTVSRLNIGNYADSTLPLNGTIKRLAFWPVRLANPTLQAITQP